MTIPTSWDRLTAAARGCIMLLDVSEHPIGSLVATEQVLKKEYGKRQRMLMALCMTLSQEMSSTRAMLGKWDISRVLSSEGTLKVRRQEDYQEKSFWMSIMIHPTTNQRYRDLTQAIGEKGHSTTGLWGRLALYRLGNNSIILHKSEYLFLIFYVLHLWRILNWNKCEWKTFVWTGLFRYGSAAFPQKKNLMNI